MTEAEKCVEDVRRIHRLLKEETGLHVIASADKQVDGKCLAVGQFFVHKKMFKKSFKADNFDYKFRNIIKKTFTAFTFGKLGN